MPWYNNPGLQSIGLGAALAGGTIASGGTLPVAAAIGLGGASLYQNYQNYAAQQENYDYQKNLQSAMFGREDTSITRRVMDLKAAGLSPVLAAGQGADAGAVVATRPPQWEKNTFDPLEIIKMQNEIATSVEQRKLMIAQSQNQLAQASVAGKIAKLKGIDVSNAEDTGNTGSSPFGRIFNDWNGFAKKAEAEINQYRQQAEEYSKDQWRKKHGATYSNEYDQIKRTNKKPRR